MRSVQLSTLLMILASALSLTTTRWSQLWDRRTLTQIAKDIRSGKQPRPSMYARIVFPVTLVLLVAGIYLAVTGH